MNLFSKVLNKVFKTGNQKELARIKPLVDEINNQEKNFTNFKNEDFKAKTYLLKKSLREGRKLDSLIPESLFLNSDLLTIFRIVRVVRIIRLIKVFPETLAILRVVKHSFAALLRIISLLVILMYFYALVGIIL
jgi:hypothetical protein